MTQPSSPPNLSQKIVQLIAQAGLSPISLAELTVLLKAPRNLIGGITQGLIHAKVVVSLSEGLYLHAQAEAQLKQLLSQHFSTNPTLDFATFKRLVQRPRKDAMNLLHHSDDQQWTVRQPNDTRLPGTRL